MKNVGIIEEIFDTAMIQILDQNRKKRCKKSHSYIKQELKNNGKQIWVCRHCLRLL